MLKNSLIIRANEVRNGMFVVALDRPWEGTPFLIQGFMVDEVEQINTLRNLCRQVIIDPSRSVPEAIHDLPDIYVPVEEEEQAKSTGNEPVIRIRYVDTDSKSGQNAVVSNRSLRDRWKNLASQLSPFERRNMDKPAVVKTAFRPPSANTQPKINQPIIYSAKTNAKADARASHKTSLTQARQVRPALPKPVLVGSHPRIDFEQIMVGLQDELTHFFATLMSIPERIGDGVTRLGKMFQPKVRVRKHIMHIKRPPERRAKSIPKTIDLVIYRSRSSFELELNKARTAVESIEETLGHMSRDMATESALRFEALPTNIDVLVESVINNPDALMWVARMREQNTFDYQHGLRVASCLLAFGRHLGFQHKQLTHLGMIGLLLDIGKMRVDPAILNKPDKLSDAEFAEAMKHVDYGLEILSGTMEVPPEVLEGIGQHHEWFNGKGYPNQLKQDGISIYGRMAAIADCYSAMTSTRPYANPLSSYDALRIIHDATDEQFDASLAEQFIQALGIFPVGTLVELSNDEVAVVVSHHRNHRLEPQVLVLTDANKLPQRMPHELNLTDKSLDEQGKPIRIRCGLPPGAHGINPRDFYLV